MITPEVGEGEAKEVKEVKQGEGEEEAAINTMTIGSQVINMIIIPIPLTLTQTMIVLIKLTATQASYITIPFSKFKAKLTQTVFIYHPNLIKMTLNR